MSSKNIFKSVLSTVLRPNAHNVLDVTILILVMENHITSYWINVITKQAEANLKLQMVLSKFFRAQTTLDRVLIKLGVIIVTHDDKLVYAIKCNNDCYHRRDTCSKH